MVRQSPGDLNLNVFITLTAASDEHSNVIAIRRTGDLVPSDGAAGTGTMRIRAGRGGLMG